MKRKLFNQIKDLEQSLFELNQSSRNNSLQPIIAKVSELKESYNSMLSGEERFAFELDIEIIVDNPGKTVLCDMCNKDFTKSDATGGFAFLSKAVCPDCEEDFLDTVKRCNEMKYVVQNNNMTFRNFVYAIRENKVILKKIR